MRLWILYLVLSTIFLGEPSASAQLSDARLDEILEARDEEQKMRDQYRHPREMMNFFEIDKNQTIVDVHAGPWYGAILFPLIGSEGHYIGAEISLPAMQPYFPEMTDSDVEKVIQGWGEYYEQRESWSDVQPKFTLLWQGEAPQELYGTVDRYLFFRVLHQTSNKLAKIQPKIIEEAFLLLKPGGIMGVIQHLAPEEHSDEWAKGGNGYMKKSRVIKIFTDAGFVLEAESEINRNPKDLPRDQDGDFPGDFVWRLPPTYRSSERDNPQSAAEIEMHDNIGESDRMTLKFRKPAK